jgi:hypothetical protein
VVVVVVVIIVVGIKVKVAESGLINIRRASIATDRADFHNDSTAHTAEA